MHDEPRRGVAVGFFDGVHLGHRKILACARRVLTFREHPLKIIAPERAPRLMTPLSERIALIRSCGVEEVVALDFTPELAAMPAEDFARRYLAGDTVSCGANWRFGRGGEGSADTLKKLGIDVRVAPFAQHRGLRISSTRIRAALESGAIADANAMLGRVWRVKGMCVRGKGLGRDIGFPTINIECENLEINLKRGVYVVELDGVRAVANYGVAPTMRERAWERPILEVHVLDGSCQRLAAERDEPIAPCEVGILRFIRPERQFASLDDLKTQIALDCESATR